MSTSVGCVELAGFPFAGPSVAASGSRGAERTLSAANTNRRFELRNAAGVSIELLALGASVHRVSLPGTAGDRVTVTRGLSDPRGYADNAAYMGAICGRYAGRIANAEFKLDGTMIQLTANDGPHHLHGGQFGFDSRLWEPTPFRIDAEPDAGPQNSGPTAGVHFDYLSPAGEEGYPGALRCRVSYSLDMHSRLRIDYQAQALDHPTPVNLTNHCYWNLSDSPQIHEHVLELAAEEVLEFDDNLLPTGVRLPVAGTALDFTKSARIGGQMQKLPAGSAGFDHALVVSGRLAKTATSDLPLVARLTDPTSGRSLQLYTDQPALVFYTGNFLDGSPGSGGHDRHAGLCLECQQFPDAPNQSGFPEAIVQVGETYRQSTVYAFAWTE